MALVSRYETYEQLGKGSSGTVHRALDIVLGQEVALRVLNADSRFSSRLLDLFFTDEQAASEWLHPNIAAIHDLGQSPAGAFMATELLTGATVRSYIGKRSELSLVHKLELMVQACHGLAHAHTKGVVHAAITPGSFFITERRQLKILDLGIRHVARSMPVAGTLGSLTYLAPEQVWEQSCDVRSDIFSAAVVFHEFLVDVHPFANAIVARAGSETLRDDITRSEDRLPDSLRDLLKRALSRSPAERPQSAFELAAALRAVELEITSPLMHRFGDRPRYMDRPHAAPDRSWEGHSNVKAFLELLRQFEDNLSMGNWSEARHCLQGMKSLNAVPDEEFIPAILDSEKRLSSAEQEGRRPAAAPVPAHAGPKYIVDTPAPSPGDRLRPVKELWVRIAGLPPIAYQILGTVAVAVLLLLAAFLANRSKQGPAKPVMAQAQVTASETHIMASWNDGGRSLATLERGSWVNILEKTPTQHQGFVFVSQSSTDKRDLPAGYVHIADLANWRSDDPDVAWGLMALGKPPADATADRIERYLSDLYAYRARYPKAAQKHDLDTESEHWTEVLAYATKPSTGAAPNPPGASPIALVTPSPDSLKPADQEKLKRLLDRMPALWEEGNLESIIDLTQQAMALDPENAQARRWRSKANKALRKLANE